MRIEVFGVLKVVRGWGRGRWKKKNGDVWMGEFFMGRGMVTLYLGYAED